MYTQLVSVKPGFEPSLALEPVSLPALAVFWVELGEAGIKRLRSLSVLCWVYRTLELRTLKFLVPETLGPSGWWKVKAKIAPVVSTVRVRMGYTVHGILQARILEWIAFSFSRGFSQPRD